MQGVFFELFILILIDKLPSAGDNWGSFGQ